MTAIKMVLQVNEKSSTRNCKVKGLVGSKKEIKAFIEGFKSKSAELAKLPATGAEESEDILD